MAFLGKVISAQIWPYCRYTANIQKTIFRVLPPAEVFKTVRVHQCAIPSARVCPESTYECRCDSLYIGHSGAPISILVQKSPRIDFFEKSAKL